MSTPTITVRRLGPDHLALLERAVVEVDGGRLRLTTTASTATLPADLAHRAVARMNAWGLSRADANLRGTVRRRLTAALEAMPPCPAFSPGGDRCPWCGGYVAGPDQAHVPGAPAPHWAI